MNEVARNSEVPKLIKRPSENETSSKPKDKQHFQSLLRDAKQASGASQASSIEHGFDGQSKPAGYHLDRGAAENMVFTQSSYDSMQTTMSSAVAIKAVAIPNVAATSMANQHEEIQRQKRVSDALSHCLKKATVRIPLNDMQCIVVELFENDNQLSASVRLEAKEDCDDSSEQGEKIRHDFQSELLSRRTIGVLA